MMPEMYWDASRVLTHLNVDNKVNFRYPDGYRFRLMQASICRAAAETKTHLANYA